MKGLSSLVWVCEESKESTASEGGKQGAGDSTPWQDFGFESMRDEEPWGSFDHVLIYHLTG